MPTDPHSKSKIQNPTCLAVIPARFASTRFPGKMLADRTGKPLLQHVWEKALQAQRVSRLIVATDDERIRDAVERFGAEAIMTRSDHPNGTSRIAEVVASLSESFSLVANIQGDEPEIDPAIVDRAIQTLEHNEECEVATLASPFAGGEDAANPNLVKVVIDVRGRALYFSRAAIPCNRDGVGMPAAAGPFKHVGLYVYRPSFLERYHSLAPTPLEQAEKLEQLRFLEHGHSVAVAVVEAHHHGIDTPEQYEAFVKRNAKHRKPAPTSGA